MNFRHNSCPICLAAAALTLSGLLVCDARGGGKERGRPIEFSLPKSDEATTNVYQMTTKKDSLKQLEEDLYKPLESFAPKSSLDGVAAPPPSEPPAPPIQSKRLKELLERRKNWGFISPEDLINAPTIEDVLKTPQLAPDGQEKKELPAFERYYQHLATKPAKADDPLQSKTDALFGTGDKRKARDERASEDDSSLPSTVRQGAERLTRAVEAGSIDSSFTRAALHGNLHDIFGLGNQSLSKEQIEEHKKYMDDYRSVVESSWHPLTMSGPQDMLSPKAPDTASPAGIAAAGLPNSLSPAPRTALEVQMGVVSPQLGPADLPDVNAQALGQTRPTSILPMDGPTRVAPPSPNFAAPKRSFY